MGSNERIGKRRAKEELLLLLLSLSVLVTRLSLSLSLSLCVCSFPPCLFFSFLSSSMKLTCSRARSRGLGGGHGGARLHLRPVEACGTNMVARRVQTRASSSRREEEGRKENKD